MVIFYKSWLTQVIRDENTAETQTAMKKIKMKRSIAEAVAQRSLMRMRNY